MLRCSAGAAAVLAGLGVASAAGYAIFWRQPPLRDLRPALPAQSYAEARDRFAAQAAHAAAFCNPLCAPQLLDHGDAVDRVIVLLHGFTNCPQQYVELAQAFHRRGCNVLVPLFPFHGYEERLPAALARLRAEDLMATGLDALDIAHGLGRSITVVGLSMGGVVTAWIAENRADVDRVVMIAPALATQPVPRAIQPLAANVLRMLPDFTYLWDRTATLPAGPPHAYAGFRSHAFAQVLRLANLVQQEATRRRPLVGSVIVVTNPTDESVDNAGAAAVVSAWRARGGQVTTYAFPSEWGLIHDLIDPSQPRQQTSRVYPQLLEWVLEE